MAGEPNFADWLAICNLKANYCNFLDKKDWTSWAKLFTEDLVSDTGSSGGGVVRGRDEFVSSVSRAIAGTQTSHQVHSPLIEIEGDKATAIWAMQDRVKWDENNALTGYGQYVEEYRRGEDGWQISSLTLERFIVEAVGAPGGSA